MFTEEESKEQDAAFASIKDEFARLVKQEEDLRAALSKMGVESNASDPNDPEVQKMFAEAQEKAKREGKLRSEEFQRNRLGKRAAAGQMPGQRRSGVIRI